MSCFFKFYERCRLKKRTTGKNTINILVNGKTINFEKDNLAHGVQTNMGPELKAG